MKLTDYLAKSGETLEQYQARKKREQNGNRTLSDYRIGIRSELASNGISDIYDALSKSNGGYIDTRTLQSYKDRVADYTGKYSKVYDQNNKNDVSYMNSLTELGKGLNEYYDVMSRFDGEDQYNLAKALGIEGEEGIKARQDWYADINKKIASTTDKKTLNSLNMLKNQYERGMKVSDDYYQPKTAEFERNAAFRDYNNPTKDQLWFYDAQQANYDYNMQQGMYRWDGQNYRDAKGNIVTEPTAPIVEDRLGLYLSSTEEEKEQALKDASATGGNFNNTYANILSEGYKNNWSNLKSNEIEIYYDLLKREGQANAEKFLSDMSAELGRREEEEYQKMLEQTSAYEKILLNLASIPMNIIGGAGSFVEDTIHSIKGEEINPYSFAHSLSNESSAIRSATSEAIDTLTKGAEIPLITKGMSFGEAYQAIMSAGDSLLGTGFGSTGYGILMGMSSASSKARELYEKGATNAQIAKASVLAGAFEMIFEKVSIEVFFSNFLESPATSKTQLLKKILVQGGVEASEEMVTELADILTDIAVMSNESDARKMYDSLKGQGMSNGEAGAATFWDKANDILKAGIGGFISGGAMGGAGMTINSIVKNMELSERGNTINTMGGTDALIKLAQETAKDREGNKSLSKLADKVSSKASNKNVGLLDEMTADATIKNNRTAIENALKEQFIKDGTHTKEAEKMSKKYVDMVMSELKGETYKGDLARNESVDKVIEQMKDEWSEVSIRNENYVNAKKTMIEKYVNGEYDKSGLRNKLTAKYKVSDDGRTTVGDKPVSIAEKPIVSIDGGLKIKLSDGTVVGADEVSFGNQGMATLLATISEMRIDPDTANTLFESINSSTKDMLTMSMAMMDAYWYGAKNINESELDNGAFTSELSDSQRSLIYSLGKANATVNGAPTQKVAKRKYEGEYRVDNGRIRDAKFGNLNEKQSSGIELAKLLSRIGANVYVYESTEDQRKNGRPNGYYKGDDGSIHIDINSGVDGEGLMAYTIAHEFTHFIETWSPAKFRAYADVLFEELHNDGISVNEMLDAEANRLRSSNKNKSERLIREEAYSEVVAKLSEKIFTDTDTLKRIANRIASEDKSLWKKICDFFRGLVDRLRNAYSGNTSLDKFKMGEQAIDTINKLETIRDIFADASVDALSNFKNAEAMTNEEAFENSEVQVLNQIRTPYTEGTKAWEEFVNGLNEEAKQIHDMFYNFYTLSKQTNVKNPQGKLVKKLNISAFFMTAQDWNDMVSNDAKWRDTAIALAKSLPENVRKNMRFGLDGKITPTTLEKEFKMAISLAQRLVDSLGYETIDPNYELGGKKINLYTGRTVQSVGGEAYRRALIAETRKLYEQGKLKKVSINTMSKDRWGSLGFLAANGKTTASGDLTTLCPQMMYNRGCFYCYRRAAMESGVNNKLVAQSVWYTGEILRIKDEDVRALNENGGLRIQSFGDWMPHFSAQLADILYDAELRGLQVKIITKEPSMIQYVAKLREQGIGKNLYFNLSADYAIEKAPKPNNVSGDNASLDAPNPNRPFMRDDNNEYWWKRAMTVEEAFEYRKRYPWVNVRIVATDAEEFIRGLKDPKVQVVTGYHGSKRLWERVDSETGAFKTQLEPMGDAGMPKWELHDGQFVNVDPGRTKTHQKLASLIEENNLVWDYYRKTCCITGRCADCFGKCGKIASDFYVKNATNADKESVAYWKEHMTKAEEEDQLFSARDSEGRELSDGQIEFFKNSMIRDDNGSLLRVYHGTDAEFYEFSYDKADKHGHSKGFGFYLTPKKSYAEHYGSRVIEAYANVNKLLFNSKKTIKQAELKKFVNALIDNDLNKYKSDGLIWQDSFISNYIYTYEPGMTRASAIAQFVNQVLSSNDNDNDIIYEIANASGNNYNTEGAREFYRVLTDSIGYDGAWYGDEIVVFDSNQIKEITNLNPTKSNDIRYSDRNEKEDSDGNSLSLNQRAYFQWSKARDDNGRLLKLYHGSQSEFNVFGQSRNSQFGAYKFGDYNVNFFTTSKRTAEGYSIGKNYEDGYVYEGYADVTNPYVFKDELAKERDYDYSVASSLKNRKLREEQLRLWKRLSWRFDVTDNIEELNKMLSPFRGEVVDYGEDSAAERYELYRRGDSFANRMNETLISYGDSVEELFEDMDRVQEGLLGVSEEYGDDDYYFTTNDVVRIVLGLNEFLGEDYDGIIIDNIFDAVNWTSEVATDVITLKSSNQFKRADNLNPTYDNDIRYSVRGEQSVMTDADRANLDLAKQMYEEKVEGNFKTRTQYNKAVAPGLELPPVPTKNKKTVPWGEVTKDLWKTDLIPSHLVDSKIRGIRNTPALKNLKLTKLDKPLMIFDTTKGQQVSYAWADELAPTLTTKCGDARIIMPDGKVYKPTPKFMGRIQGLPDNYVYPKSETRAFTIIGNGIPTQLTRAVIGGALESAYEQVNDERLFSERTTEPPKNVKKAYKLMRLVDGVLHPLFIGNNEEVKIGVWYDAESPDLSSLKDLPAGTHLINMSTGEATPFADYLKSRGLKPKSTPNVSDIKWATENGCRFMLIEEKAGGKSEGTMLKKYGDTRAYYNWGINGSMKSDTGEGSSSVYALRPGWHFGEVPSMHQIGYGDDKDIRLDNQVWTECEMSADVDYNSEAQSNWSGDIPTHIPTNGYYQYATNPTQKKSKSGNSESDKDKPDWYVAGAFRVVRIISDSEADAIVEEVNRESGKHIPLDYRRLNGRRFNANTMSLDDTLFSDRRAEDAVKYFGITDNPSEAGYMLRDGRMLKFKNDNNRLGWDEEFFKEFGDHIDHHAIYEVYGDEFKDSPTDAIDQFVSEGNIRLVIDDANKNTDAIQIHKNNEPSNEQYQALRTVIDKTFAKGKSLVVGFPESGMYWNRDEEYKVYPADTKTERVIGDIKYFYANGELRGGVSEFRSDREGMSNRELLVKALRTTTKDPTERERLKAYKNKVDLMNAEQDRLAEVKARIKEISFGKGKRDMALLKDLNATKAQMEERINRYDKSLLQLESTAILKNVVKREAAKAQKKEAEKYRENLKLFQKVADDRVAKKKLKNLERIKKVREKANERIEDIKQKNRESKEKYFDRKNKAELRREIKKLAEDLQSRLNDHGTNSHYVPSRLAQGAIDVCLAIDLSGKDQTTKAYEKYRTGRQALLELKSAYDSLKAENNYEFSSEFNEEFSSLVGQFADEVGDTPLRLMEADQLSTVYDILHDIVFMIKTATKQIGIDESITNYQAGDELIESMLALARLNIRDTKFSRVMRNWTENPMRAVYEMSGFNTNNRLYKLFEQLNEGRRKMEMFRMNATKAFDNLRMDAEGKKNFNDAVEKAFDFGLTAIDGSKLKISKMQAMQLVLTYNRENANEGRKHLESGVIIPDVDLQRKGKFDEAFDKGQRTGFIDKLFIDKIYSKLSEWDKKYMAEARKFFNETSTDAVNEYTLTTRGRIITHEKEYIPYVVNRDEIATDSELVKLDATIAGMGILKDVKKNAPQMLIMNGLNLLLDKHINDTAKLYGLGVPVRNFDKVINMKQTPEDGGEYVKTVIRKVWTNFGLNLIVDSVAELQSTKAEETVPILGALKSAMVTSVLGSSLSVSMKQASSYPTAGAILSGKSLYSKKALSVFTAKTDELSKIFAEIDSHTAQHWLRRQGLSMQELGEINQSGGWKNKVNQKLGNWSPLNWIQAIDVRTTAALWEACKLEVQDTGDKELYWKNVTNLYDKVIEETQPMYDKLHRAKITKTKAVSNFILFKTQPLQNSGLIREATMGYRFSVKKYGKDSAQAKEANKKLRKVVSSQMASHLVFTSMTLLSSMILHKMKRYRDDDDELNALTVLGEFGGQFFKAIYGAVLPIIGDYSVSAFEIVFMGARYDIISDSVLDKINTSFENLAKLKNPSFNAFATVATDVATYFGIPAGNVRNIIEGIIKHIIDIINGEFLSFNSDLE